MRGVTYALMMMLALSAGACSRVRKVEPAAKAIKVKGADDGESPVMPGIPDEDALAMRVAAEVLILQELSGMTGSAHAAALIREILIELLGLGRLQQMSTRERRFVLKVLEYVRQMAAAIPDPPTPTKETI